MKRIEAFIKPFTVEEVKKALYDAGVPTVRIGEVKELTRSNTYAEVYRGVEYEVDVVPRASIVVHVENGDVDRVAAVIASAARTESRGDGVITVSPIEAVMNLDAEEISS